MEKKLNSLFVSKVYMLGNLEKENGEICTVVIDNMGFVYTTEELEELENAIKNIKEINTKIIEELNEERYNYFNCGIKNEKLIKSKNKTGFVYVLKKTDENVFKIGMSKKFDERKKQIGTKLPFEVQTFKLFKTNDMESLEKHFHEKFNKKRLNGEWFKLDLEDIGYIKSFSLTYNGVV